MNKEAELVPQIMWKSGEEPSGRGMSPVPKEHREASVISESPRRLVKAQISGPHPQSFSFSRSGVGPRTASLTSSQ